MRTIIRGSLTIAAAVLAGLATSAAAQTANPPTTQQTAATTSSAAQVTTTGKTVSVTVTVYYNKNKKALGVVASPDPVAIDKGDILSWTLVSEYDDDMTITMVDGTKPFPKQPKKNSKKDSVSDPADGGPDFYKYLVTVGAKGKTFKHDPIIKINP